jgi:hypothetical protein
MPHGSHQTHVATSGGYIRCMHRAMGMHRALVLLATAPMREAAALTVRARVALVSRRVIVDPVRKVVLARHG